MADTDRQSTSQFFARDAKVGFAGAGRLGSSLAIAMNRAGYNVAALSSRRESHRAWLKSKFPGSSIHDDPRDLVAESQIVFVTTSDGAIKHVADSLPWRSEQAGIHCSGAASLDLLSSASTTGAAVGGFHPMQTFPTPDSADSFDGITFGVEAPDSQLNSWLSTLAADLGGHAFSLTARQRPAYHAAAVMACGLLAGLTGLAAEIWVSSGGVSRQQALAALTPLVKSTANSIGENGLPDALTGPYVRGDVETVRAHVKASTAVSAEMGAAYSALANATLHIAGEQGNLTAEAAKSIKEILISTLRANCEKIDEA